MKLSNLLVAAAALSSLSALSTAAFADDVTSTNNSQIYVGAEGGLADAGFDLDKFYKSYIPSDLTGTDLTSVSYKRKSYNLYGNLHVGMLFPVADDISVGGQLGYDKFGNQQVKLSATNYSNVSDSSKESEKISDLNAELVVQGVYNKFFGNVHGGMGYFMIDNSGEVKNFSSGVVPASAANTTGAPQNKNSLRPIAGVEFGYSFTDHVQGYVDYNHVFGTNTHGDFSNKVPNINTLGVGVNYVF